MSAAFQFAAFSVNFRVSRGSLFASHANFRQ